MANKLCLFTMTAGIFIIFSANHSAVNNVKENGSLVKYH